MSSAKRIEFNAVIMVGVEEGAFTHYLSYEEGVAEDRRLFYVGVIRTKRKLHLMYSKTASVFLKDLLVRDLVALTWMPWNLVHCIPKTAERVLVLVFPTRH